MTSSYSKFAIPGILICGLSLFCACGDDITQVDKIQESAIFSTLEDSLPTCDKHEQGTLYSLNNSLYLCNGIEWESLDGISGNNLKEPFCYTKQVSEGLKIICGQDSIGIIKNEAAEHTYCTTEKTTTGYNIICNGKKKGSISNGSQGATGSKGKAATGCTFTKNEDNSYTQKCGEKETIVYAALCGTTPYDPNGDKFCDGISLIDKCGGEPYTTEQFCGSDNKVYSRCNGNTFDVTKQFCFNKTLYNLCGVKTYNPNTEGCSNNSVYTKGTCGTATYNTSTHLCDTRDNKLYRYITVGTKKWMAQNLNRAISNSYCYNLSNDKCNTYGRLYTWSTLSGLCPSGWSVPTKSDWENLFSAVGGKNSAGGKLKSKSGWKDNGNGTDDISFGALPGGHYTSASFVNSPLVGYYYTSTPNGDYIYTVEFHYNSNAATLQSQAWPGNYRSLRCVK